MLKLNIENLRASIRNAASYEFPVMDKGTAYLYESIYRELAAGKAIRFSNLDFAAFDTEDLTTFYDLLDGLILQNSHKAFGVANTLKNVAPMCKETAYV
jgi:hypothetical protein